MANSIRLTNAAGRDGTVQSFAPQRQAAPSMGLPGHKVTFRRYLASTEACRGDSLASRLGEDYAQALIDGDPEIDIEHVGRLIGETNTVYLTREGQFLHSPPRMIEIISGADGTERERRDPLDSEANVDAEYPLRWSGKKIPISEAVRRFVFRRSLQVNHLDGVTYDFLYGMAKELAESASVMLIGAGAKGNEPLIFQVNGRPMRGFLSGKVEGERYQLMLHLSDMELKRPGEKEA